MSKKYQFVVFTNPLAGRDEEFNAWYTGVHLDDVLAVPGINAAQRFKLATPDDKAAGGYLAIYEIETDDIDKTMADLNGRAGTPKMVLSDAMDMTRVSATLFEPITGRVLSKNQTGRREA